LARLVYYYNFTIFHTDIYYVWGDEKTEERGGGYYNSNYISGRLTFIHGGGSLMVLLTIFS